MTSRLEIKNETGEYPSIWATLPVRAAESEENLSAALSRITHDNGFVYFSYSGRFTIDSRDGLEKVLSSPIPVITASSSDTHEGLLTLVARHARGRLIPFIWSETCDAASCMTGDHNLSHEAHRLGLSDGVSFPIHDGTGDFGVLSFAVDSDAIALGDRAVLADGLLIAALAHDAMRRLVNKSAKILEKPLTARETECLRLIAIGKSTWEMSKILGLSEHGVLHHVRSIMSKFRVHHRHQAVIRATTCGLL